MFQIKIKNILKCKKITFFLMHAPSVNGGQKNHFNNNRSPFFHNYLNMYSVFRFRDLALGCRELLEFRLYCFKPRSICY